MEAAVDHRRDGNDHAKQQELLRQVDPHVWQACAGSSIHIPEVNSWVCYFLQGHMEHASDKLPLSAFHPALESCPYILCRVEDVQFMANRNTDEVCTNIRLRPLVSPKSGNGFPVQDPGTCSSDGTLGLESEGEEGRGQQDNGMVSFAKVLTPSDANNGGGFSVPKFCADSIFPPLDYEADPPVQNIKLQDVLGKSWEFRHIYRGKPLRHLLTTGWSKFVNSKKLIAGDSVVFIKNKTSGELHIGVRRPMKTSAAADFAVRCAAHYESLGLGMAKPADGGVRIGEKEGVFSRSEIGKVPSESVVKAANCAASGQPFDVLYYPRVGSPNFVVDAHKVMTALAGMYWSTGIRVKMAMETEDSSRITSFQGTVSSVVTRDSGFWKGSPWRMLQVEWDEPEVLQNIKNICPWDVECVQPAPSPLAIPPVKKSRASPPSEGHELLSPPVINYGNSALGQFTASHLNYTSSRAGMQGVRQDTWYVSNLKNTHQVCDVGSCNHTKEDAVSTDLSIGNSQYESTHDSTSSADFIRAPTVKRFQLFGQIISVEMNPDDDVDLTQSDKDP